MSQGMRPVLIIGFVILVSCVYTSESKKHKYTKPENQEEKSGEGTWKQVKEFARDVLDVLSDRILNFRVFPAVDIASNLINGFNTETLVTDLTTANEAIRGMEFDDYDENHGNRVMKGIKLEEFEKVVRVIADSNDFPEKFVNEILLGKDMVSNESQKMEFYFNIGKKSDVWYCVVNTVKVGDKIDLAMAYYNLKFKLADRKTRHTKVQRFLGIPLWTDEWTTSEPRKLSTNDQNLFVNFLRAKAVTGFMKDHYQVAYGNPDLNLDHRGDEL
jgi:hypothetical protein